VDGEEGCWTLRDTASRRSFAVFHNGPEREPPQRIRLTVRNAKGETRSVDSERSELAPYETVKVYPREWIPDLVESLGGAPGFATLSFKLNEGFTRMLVGTEAVDGSDLQVTHSNFNYGKHQTDLVTAEKSTAYMYTSCFPDLKRTGLVYPDTEPGKYWMPEAPKFLGGVFGFYTLYSEYGGLWCFSTLEKETGGFAVEHGF
jgi:hypothetical protein